MTEPNAQKSPSDSDVSYASALSSTSRSRLDYELRRCTPFTFPELSPVDIGAIYMSPNFQVLDLFGDQRIQWRQPPEPASQWQPRPRTSPKDSFSSNDADHLATENISGNAQQSLALCDERLNQLQIGHWTSVPISSIAAAALISFYLEKDHAILGLFDADLFVEGLTTPHSNFCSPLLVNSVLSWACHAYSSAVPDTIGFGPMFEEQAREQWLSERSSPSVLTLASTILLGLRDTWTGKGRSGSQFFDEALRITEHLDLFGQPDEIARDFDDLSMSRLRAYSHAAWSMFNWQVSQAFQCNSEPVKRLPKFHIPGDEGIMALGPTGRMSKHTLPKYMGETFTTLCKFWMIANELAILQLYGSSGGSSAQDEQAAMAEKVYRKLLNWSRNTRFHVVSQTSMPAEHEMIACIHYHAAVMDLLRPLIGRGLQFQASSKPEITPDSVYLASLTQMKRYVLFYSVLHHTDTCSIWWHPALLRVANVMITDDTRGDRRFFFLLAVYGYQSLSKQFAIAGVFLRVLLHMAVEKYFISASEARGLGDDAPDILSSDDCGNFVVDLDTAMTDRNAAKLMSMAIRYTEARQESQRQNVDPLELKYPL